MATKTNRFSYLDLVNICGNMRVRRPSPIPQPEFDSEQLAPLYLNDTPNSPVIGLLRPQIVDLLDAENKRSLANGGPQLWSGIMNAPGLRSRIGFHASVNTHAKRTAVMKELCERWRDTGVFPDIIGPGKWRAEMYPVYRDPFGVHDYPRRESNADAEAEAAEMGGSLNFAFEMERAACALFGIVTYGVHMSTYQEYFGDNGERSLRVWTPTRARTKSMCVPLAFIDGRPIKPFSGGLGISTIRWPGGYPVVCPHLKRWLKSAWRRRA
jgi:hypothetical protein